MKDLFVPYEIALQLKELGFNEPCFKKYIAGCLWSSPTVPEIYENIHPNSSDCLAPTFSQAFRWFREKHNLPNHIHTMWQNDWNDYSYQWHITEDKKEWNCIEHFKTYEEAELACLRKLISIIKEKL